jgi:DNA-binding transcriptional ArsR family regulator
LSNLLDEYVTTDHLSRTFAALADPTRRAILERLLRGEATVNELADPFDMSLQAVSKHLTVLERAGLITRGRQAQWRPARLRGRPLAEAAHWLDRYREYWQGGIDPVDQRVRAPRQSGVRAPRQPGGRTARQAGGRA